MERARDWILSKWGKWTDTPETIDGNKQGYNLKFH